MRFFRIAVAALGFFGAFFLPSWVPVVCMIVLALRFRAWEAIALGFFIDLAWYTPLNAEGLSLVPLFTLISIALVWGFEPLRVEFLR